MRFLLEPDDAHDLGAAVEAAAAARDGGLDGILLAPTPRLSAPLVVAAAIAPVVDGILLAAEVPVGDRHPIELAEESAVTDLVASGRLVLVARPAGGHEPRFSEALDLLRTAFAARPFRFEGAHWTVPAGLPQNEHNREQRTRVTPAPLQARLEVWTAGGLPDERRAIGHLAPEDADPRALGAAWRRAEQTAGPALIGAPRARRHEFDAPAGLLAALLEGRRAFGQDWAVVRAPRAAAAEIGRAVRPHVQIDRLPPGLAEHWAGALTGRPTDW